MNRHALPDGPWNSLNIGEPYWKHYTQMPRVYVDEAVMLSLDISPLDALKISQVAMELFDVMLQWSAAAKKIPDEFNSLSVVRAIESIDGRRRLLMRRIDDGYPELDARLISSGSGEFGWPPVLKRIFWGQNEMFPMDSRQFSISLRGFAGLCVRYDWNIPDQLRALADQEQPQAYSKWPWGDHDTELLRHLAAAGERWGPKFYDPDDPRGTAPTNPQIVKLLVNRGVKLRMAEAMATILRKDGLETGRRPGK